MNEEENKELVDERGERVIRLEQEGFELQEPRCASTNNDSLCGQYREDEVLLCQ
jgi:hypothetical protein